jgi:hypothetical protein
MKIAIEQLADQLETETPAQHFWLLFKVGSHEHMRAMQRGLIYMNSVAYFAKIESEINSSLRGDPDEPLLVRIHGGSHENLYHQIILEFKNEERIKSFDISEHTKLTLTVPTPENVVIFSCSALSDDVNGLIYGECDGKVSLDKRFLGFGSHVLIIRNATEFSNRVSSAIKKTPNLYSSKYFQGGFGRVKYVDRTGGIETLGLFRKSHNYEWQQEFRFILGARNEALNKQGALELQIGDISDITELIALESLLSSPLKVTRRHIPAKASRSKTE